MIRPNAFSFQMLTDDQIRQVHEATLTVLEKTGVVMDHPRAMEALSAAGCDVAADGRTRFPADVVEAAIREAPDSLDVYSRDGQPRMTLAGRNVYYGTVTTLPFIADLDGRRRDYTLEDCRQMTVIADHLDTLDFATGTGNCTDVPVAVSDVHEIGCMIENSPKPVLITTHDENGLRAIMDICAIHKDGAEAFVREPFVIYCTCPISPLQYSTSSLAKMILAIESGLPFVSVPAPGAGASSPITVAGTLVTGNAEILAGLVLAQAMRPGTSFLYGGFFTVMDMGSAVMTHGSPEFNLLNVAQAELARHYGLPSFSSAGCTDSHEIDEQTAFESGFSTMTAALGGANLVHAIGVLGAGTAVSKELLVLSHEFISYTKRFCRGIGIDERTLAVDEIDQVGPGGGFLETDLTLDLFKRELWHPQCFARDNFDSWVAEGKTTLKQRLAQECERILSTHTPAPVAEDKLAEIRKLIECSDKERLAGSG